MRKLNSCVVDFRRIPFFRGERHCVPSPPACLTDDPEGEIEAVCVGAGFGWCAAYLNRPSVRKGRLIRLLPGLEPEPRKLHVDGRAARRDAAAYAGGVRRTGGEACARNATSVAARLSGFTSNRQ
ncbi:hypothetical protein [Burkholderia seminalis]|uniref:hypothetical protein n=1 Tax=Burkholderia seminalis TaxID=488731 RepID=UPI0026532F6B|nr:hypothetical protein [Burkholderia seminalis]MDN7587844.1 hypothetical protein [Burkholderia seminalis]